MVGLIVRFFPDDLLRQIADPRHTRGRRWKSDLPLLRALMVGLACGCRGFREVEELTTDMASSIRKLLGIPRRIPDTTLRDFVCKLDPGELSKVLSIVGYDAWRRKALQTRENFPFGVLSMDGKCPAIRDIGNHDYLQVHHDESGQATHGLVRTVTSILATVPGRPILGALPIRGDTNELGSFQDAFAQMVRIYGRLFHLVMYDAGGASAPNAQAVRAAKKHYFFQIANTEWVMYQTMELLFKEKAALARHEEQISSRKRVVRELTMHEAIKTKKSLTLWPHTKSLFKVYSETYEDDVLTATKTRYFVSSLECSAMSAEQYLRLVVLRWGVESAHQILDTAFQEDRRPWITKNAQGALAVMLARRAVYTILSLFKSVSLRSDENREMPWRRLMERIKDAMKWSSEADLTSLRPRSFALPKALA
jgi:LmbE family N-acetylglucosaminyl deacetylase